MTGQIVRDLEPRVRETRDHDREHAVRELLATCLNQVENAEEVAVTLRKRYEKLLDMSVTDAARMLRECDRDGLENICEPRGLLE